ncbi:MAG: non-canonical purine NTP pyrophosphatase, RdgB/HAM1 family [Acidobacteria bacterium]|nr:MAG: non-canonical purine NTP pyrophosphatase, RdgB/HAM1 family [Acidobacteriota bacterium]
MKLYCATGNAGKLREFQLAAQKFEIELAMPPGWERIAACEETGSTFEENAVLKATYYGGHAPGLLFADDSGLEVDALNGAPGVRSARYAGQSATDQDNNDLLLAHMHGGISKRRARFVCVLALAEGTDLIRTFRGVVEGALLEPARGIEGFGYDSLFYYPPFGCSFGEIDSERKMTVSHRGKALEQLFRYVREGE